MKYILRLLLLLIATFYAGFSYSQEANREGEYILMPLSPQEEIMLQSLPELKLPASYANRDLPYMVDNSQHTCMRPAYQQDGLSCGQASCIGYNFTYEMARERDLNASLTQNQYPTHFAWNFMNGGEGWYGSSYLHSILILKEFGMPNVVDYGGTMGYGGPKRWMSGYDQYYNSMHNRISTAYQIQAGTPEGLLVFKHWLHSHLEDSPIGGIASFYAQHMTPTSTLPAGTEEAGKYVLTYFGGSPNHAMTIVGYNDSIRFDYNSDGQFTNHIDINNDNVVNMKDWEIGGFKMVQSYGGVPNWGNQGFAYMMYKTIADNLGSGGIWNHCVHVLDVKETCDPKLTAKIILEHNRRKLIKVQAGISNNVNTGTPELVMGFPIFDFHGGDNYMQGGTTEEANKTIEFGLDLSKLLSYTELGHPVRLFLQVVEQDTASSFTGKVVHFSIFDHTAGGTQVTCNQSNVPISNNDTTTMSLVHTFNFDRVAILDETIPPAPEGEYYSHQLTAAGGTEPYIWEFDKTYGETSQNAAFPMITANQLTPTNSTSGYVTQPIGFDFPFYDSTYSSITLHVDGYLMFDQQLYPFPYYDDDKVLFYITRNISPFLNKHQETSGGGGIWYEGDSESATFRFKTRLTEDPTKVLNYAVRLFPDGTIRFFYGSMQGCDKYLWMAGISDGDNFNYQATAGSNRPTIMPNSSVTLTRYNYPPEMELSDNGLFFGTPQQTYGNEQITFKITDNNFIHTKKTFNFSSTGVIVSDSIISGGDEVISFGETAWMNIKVMNMRSDTLKNATMSITIDDPYITLTDGSETLGDILPGQLNLFPDAFHFGVSTDIPNEHLINIETTITTDAGTYETSFFHYVFAPIISTQDITVEDENGRLDAGETSNISVSILNAGGIGVTSLNSLLTSTDPYVSINQGFSSIPLLDPGQVVVAAFNLSVSSECPPGHAIDFTLNMTGDGNFSAEENFTLVVGLYRENFETGDFSLFTWGQDGARGWTIDTFDPYEGSFCARSGVITHNEESVLRLDMDVLSDGMISFYQRTSCENDTSVNNNFDHLCFKIDGTEMGRWDSVTYWKYQEFPVTAGFHRFEWVYRKDNSVNFRKDAAWLDQITLPSAHVRTPGLLTDPDSLTYLMQPGEPETAYLILTNTGGGTLNFTADITGKEPSRKQSGGGRSIEGSHLVINAEKFHTGVEYPWNMRVYNAGYDNEWIKQVYVTFPYGFELVSTTDFVGGSGGPMVYDGVFGNGVTGHWFGEDANGWGVVHMGELASCDVSVIPALSLQQDVAINYEVKGEVYGGTPHDVYGSVPLRNLGPVVSWLSLDQSGGILEGGQTETLLLTMTTEGMEDGTYEAWILLGDNYGHEQIIPVSLTLDTYLTDNELRGAGNQGRIIAMPNPFSDKTVLTLNMDASHDLTLRIYSASGNMVYTDRIQNSSYGGTIQYEWNGRNQDQVPLPSGIYLLRVDCATQAATARLIISR